jgi:salicylate hydroxylase
MVPFLAQGAAMAIEDAAILGAELAASPDDVSTAFSAYENARKRRVTKVWQAARRAGEHYHVDGGVARARDMALRFLGPRLILMRNDWIYRWTAT